MVSLATIETEHLTLEPPSPDQASELLALIQRNRQHFAIGMPQQVLQQDHPVFWQRKLEQEQQLWQQDKAYNFYGRLKESGQLICHVQVAQVYRGIYQGADLGYKIDYLHQGQSLMYEALQAVIEFSFQQLKLHRLVANHLPDNERSARLLHRLNFRREGYAERYLYLNGEWRDHVLNALDYQDFDPDNLNRF
jgi:ribosomal-protein-alanine N-acetyltransferase